MHAFLWWSAGAGNKVHQGSSSGKAGRPREPHNTTAIERCDTSINPVTHEGQPSYSEQQLYYNGDCRPPSKHVILRAVRSANYSKTALACRVCRGGGSKWERMLYDLLDKEDLIELYAVEAFSLSKPVGAVTQGGVVVHPEKKRWDATVVVPGGLLIEMQGEGHGSRLVTKANNTDNSLAERHLKDWLYVQVALEQQWSVLWLWVNEDISSDSVQASVWAQQLHKAVLHVQAKGLPQLFGA